MVLLSQTTEYALRAMVQLATVQATAGTAVEVQAVLQTAPEIAEAMQVPRNYLSKVLQQLVRAGLVNSHRGVGGGFSLTRDPSVTTVYDVVQAVDPIERLTGCPLNLPAHARRLCPMHTRLDRATAAIEEQFRSSTIDELIDTPRNTDRRRLGARPAD